MTRYNSSVFSNDSKYLRMTFYLNHIDISIHKCSVILRYANQMKTLSQKLFKQPTIKRNL